MGKDAALAAITKFRASLERHGVRPSRIVLFGSHAHGAPREDSDIDLVVVSASFAGRDLWERIQLLTPAVLESDPLIEPVGLTPEEWERGDSVIVDYAANGVEV